MISNTKWIKPAAGAIAAALFFGAVSTPAMAGRVVARDGIYVSAPINTSEVVRSHRTDVHRMVFRGGERATVSISGDGDSDLDLYVYDNNNNLICSADSLSDDEQCRFTPRYTGQFRIEVRNLGVANLYQVWTN